MGTDGEGQTVAAVVAENVLRLRKQRGLTVRQLSERLAELGAPILASGITKIEQQQRKVDVNDLVALAAALNTSPAVLLAPDVQEGEDRAVAVTPERVVKARDAWWWVTAARPLPPQPGTHARHNAVHQEFRDVLPRWVRAMRSHPAITTLDAITRTVNGIVTGEQDKRRVNLRLTLEILTGGLIRELEGDEDSGAR